MAQADGVVANGTGSAVRSDINTQYAALWSNHSGSTEPSSGKVAYQTWADTNSGYLKIRNAANNAWIQLFKLDGTDICRLTGSTNNQITTVTGANAIQGEANLIFDGSSLGIGCTPNRELHVKGLDGTIRLESTAATGRTWIEFFDTSAIKGSIGYPSSGNNNLAIQQSENADMYFTTNDSERLRLDSSGNLALGTTSPNNYSNYTTFTINGTTGAQLDIQSNGTKYGDIYTQSNAFHIRNKQPSGSGFLAFHTTNSGSCSERLRILSGGGITFNGDTAAANALDSYEEGTWTPANTHLAITNNATATYTKVGRLVTVQFDCTYASSPADTAAVGGTIDGLPFQPESSGFHFTPTFLNSAGNAIGDNESYGFLSYVEGSSNNRIILYSLSQGGVATRGLIAGTRVRATVTYFST